MGFVLIEFAGSALSEWAGYAAGLLYLVGFLALAQIATRGSAAAPAATPGLTLPSSAQNPPSNTRQKSRTQRLEEVECAEPAVELPTTSAHSTR
jgi:hypothetical protein